MYFKILKYPLSIFILKQQQPFYYWETLRWEHKFQNNIIKIKSAV